LLISLFVLGVLWLLESLDAETPSRKEAKFRRCSNSQWVDRQSCGTGGYTSGADCGLKLRRRCANWTDKDDRKSHAVACTTDSHRIVQCFVIFRSAFSNKSTIKWLYDADDSSSQLLEERWFTSPDDASAQALSTIRVTTLGDGLAK